MTIGSLICPISIFSFTRARYDSFTIIPVLAFLTKKSNIETLFLRRLALFYLEVVDILHLFCISMKCIKQHCASDYFVDFCFFVKIKFLNSALRNSGIGITDVNYTPHNSLSMPIFSF